MDASSLQEIEKEYEECKGELLSKLPKETEEKLVELLARRKRNKEIYIPISLMSLMIMIAEEKRGIVKIMKPFVIDGIIKQLVEMTGNER